MTIGESWHVKGLSDDDLLRGLLAIRGRERLAVAQVVAHLAEVEARGLHLRTGSPSLFDYCVRRLAMSEGEAFRRITAARLARRFPTILGQLACGDIHLCALCELRDFLTPGNHLELLSEASGKTKRQVVELLARRAPKPDAHSTVRKLPPPRLVSSEVLATTQETQTLPPSVPLLPPRLSKPVVEPLREDRYRLQLNASAMLKHKLELARDLMSHSNPTGDLAAVVERALEVLIDKIQRERLAQTSAPRASTKAQPGSRHIPNSTRRQVVERDGLQCTYVAPDGERCTSRRFLQFSPFGDRAARHHEHAWARGGPSTTDNIRLLCAAHNRMLAEDDFGRERVTGAIEAKRVAR
jgi:hypothetical protein